MLIVNRRKAIVSLRLVSGNTAGGRVEVQWLMKPPAWQAVSRTHWQHPRARARILLDGLGWLS